VVLALQRSSNQYLAIARAHANGKYFIVYPHHQILMASPQLSGEYIPSDTVPSDDFMSIFYVGHHESRRPLPISDSVLRRAQDVGVSGRAVSLLKYANSLSTTCSPAR
jgi:hypothetical protein